MRQVLRLICTPTAACLSLTACASTTEPAPEAVAPTATVSSVATYNLNEEELALDCKRLTGRMQVRILQIRDYDTSTKGTMFSRLLQSATTTIIGGTKEGASPSDRYVHDRAVLEAYNRQLAAKGCPMFDLDAELKPKPVNETPAPASAPAPSATVTPSEPIVQE